MGSMMDEVAIVGVGVSPYSRDQTERSLLTLTLEACVAAIRDSGIDRSEIDGLSGSTVAAHFVQMALGIPETTWFANLAAPFSNQLTSAVNAVHAGTCNVALVYNSHMLTPGRSRAAASDPYRVRQDLGVGDIRSWRGAGHVEPEPGSLFGIAAYAAWANRYMDEFGASREDFGRIAINGRSNAESNPNAVMRKPLSMDDYLAGRMIREPMCLYDMDLPVDGADAFVVTTAERARDLTDRQPVLVHAQSMGQDVLGDEDQNVSFDRTGQTIAMRALWRSSELALDDIDVLLLYDGFTIITMSWLENVGLCGRGEAKDLLADASDRSGSLLLRGKWRLNPHGGSLSEGATSGSGHVREAVQQLRREAGPRQVPAARAALVTIGGLFFNPAAYVLRGG